MPRRRKGDSRYIDGIYNWCDRWCERCAFTDRCRSFAMEAEILAELRKRDEEPVVSGAPKSWEAYDAPATSWDEAQRAKSEAQREAERERQEIELEIRDAIDQSDRDDNNGSAKVALIGMDRSIATWTILAQHGLPDTQPLIRHLDQLRRVTEQVFPNARAFVRPGLDWIDGQP